MKDYLGSPVNEATLANYELLPGGVIVECGVWQCRTTNIIAKARPNFQMYGFDSFRGLPEDWIRGDQNISAKHFDKRGNVPRRDVPSNVKLIAGWFNETLPPFVAEHPSDFLAYLHVDCDIYSSTVTVLNTLSSMLRPGTIIVFDDMFNYPGWEQHEAKAMFEFFSETDWRVEWLGKQYGITRHPTKDEGFWTQSVAIRIW